MTNENDNGQRSGKIDLQPTHSNDIYATLVGHIVCRHQTEKTGLCVHLYVSLSAHTCVFVYTPLHADRDMHLLM